MMIGCIIIQQFPWVTALIAAQVLLGRSDQNNVGTRSSESGIISAIEEA